MNILLYQPVSDHNFLPEVTISTTFSTCSSTVSNTGIEKSF